MTVKDEARVVSLASLPTFSIRRERKLRLHNMSCLHLLRMLLSTQTHGASTTNRAAFMRRTLQTYLAASPASRLTVNATS